MCEKLILMIILTKNLDMVIFVLSATCQYVCFIDCRRKNPLDGAILNKSGNPKYRDSSDTAIQVSDSIY